jgi:Lar family restriction alleviation protein
MSDLRELLPCPFCGGEAKRFDIEEREDVENAGASFITCTRCDASTALHFDRKENLLSSWNDRVVDAQLASARKALEVTDAMVKKALDAWFSGWCSEGAFDERMRAALKAALSDDLRGGK